MHAYPNTCTAGLQISGRHTQQINLCTNIYFIDMWSLSQFDETECLLPPFKNNMCCHHGARKRSIHDVKMTHARFIEIPHLYITPFILQFKMTLYHLTSYLLTFVRESLVSQSFHFFTVCILVYNKEKNPERQMTLLIYRYSNHFQT